MPVATQSHETEAGTARSQSLGFHGEVNGLQEHVGRRPLS
jgi:hypothetical protein